MEFSSYILEDFQIKYFAERLKEIAKNDFGGVGKLAEKIGLTNLSPYTAKNPKEPMTRLLYRFASVGIDINYLLTGEIILKKEDFEERFSLLEARILELEAENYRNIKRIEKLSENELKLTKEKEALESDKEVLLSQVVTLNKNACTKALKGQ